MTKTAATKKRIRISQDICPGSPRTEYDNAATMIDFRGGTYRIGDGDENAGFGDWLDDVFCPSNADIREICVWMVKHRRTEYQEWMDVYRDTDSCKDSREAFVDDYIRQSLTDDDEDIVELIGPMIVGWKWLLIFGGYRDGRMTVSDFNDCPGGTSPEGILVMNDETVQEEWSGSDDPDESAKNCMLAEIRTYSQWASGDVWVVETEYAEECDCCNNVEWLYGDTCGGLYGLHDDDDFARYVEETVGSDMKELIGRAVDNPGDWIESE